MISFKIDAKIISAESKPYSFAGNEGVSHKIRFMTENEIYVAKSNQDQVKYAKTFLDKDVTLGIVLGSPKENLTLAIDSIE